MLTESSALQMTIMTAWQCSRWVATGRCSLDGAHLHASPNLTQHTSVCSRTPPHRCLSAAFAALYPNFGRHGGGTAICYTVYLLYVGDIWAYLRTGFMFSICAGGWSSGCWWRHDRQFGDSLSFGVNWFTP
jgi:hypothetical protein